ncbi:MAG: universal stress protein, partial [Thermoproteota archaeon]|nr:universal stress protein [Thermoproteota archaeon]
MATSINKILVPLDNSKNSFRGLSSAIYLAKNCDAKVIALHAVYAPPKGDFDTSGKFNKNHKKQLDSMMNNRINIEFLRGQMDKVLEDIEALKDKNLKEVADALTDILVVTYGAGAAFGIDLDKCFNEVHRSNMSKLSEEGKPIYNEFGKV